MPRSPYDLLLFITTRLLYRKACRAMHAFHTFMWNRFGLFTVSAPHPPTPPAIHSPTHPLTRPLAASVLPALQEPYAYEDSVLGFVEPKLGTLTNAIGVTYLINVCVALLVGQ